MVGVGKGMRLTFTGCTQDQQKWGNYTGDYTSLTVGESYEVEKAEVHTRHTKIYLKNIQGSFNSVCFKEETE